MAGIGNILAVLSGTGQGVTQDIANQGNRTANDYNQNILQQQLQDQQGQNEAMQFLQSVNPNNQGQSSASAASPSLPSSPIGDSIMQPGQPSVPMQKPPVINVQPQQPPPSPVAAPVNQQTNQAQSPVENPLMASLAPLAPILRDPKFAAMSPAGKKATISILMQMQSQYVASQRQAAQDKLMVDRDKEIQNTLTYEGEHGGQKPPTTPKPNDTGGGQPTLSDSAIDKLADQFAKTGKLPPGLGYRMTPDKRAIMERAMEKNPDIDLASAGVGYTGELSGARTVGTSGGRIELAANSLDQAIPLARAAVKKVDLSNYPSINAVENAARSGTGDPNIVALNTALQTVVSDYSSLIARNGQQTEGTRATARELVNKNMSSGQLDAFFNQVEKEKTAQLKAVKKTQRELLGGDTQDETPAEPVNLIDKYGLEQ